MLLNVCSGIIIIFLGRLNKTNNQFYVMLKPRRDLKHQGTFFDLDCCKVDLVHKCAMQSHFCRNKKADVPLATCVLPESHFRASGLQAARYNCLPEFFGCEIDTAYFLIRHHWCWDLSAHRPYSSTSVWITLCGCFGAHTCLCVHTSAFVDTQTRLFRCHRPTIHRHGQGFAGRMY